MKGAPFFELYSQIIIRCGKYYMPGLKSLANNLK